MSPTKCMSTRLSCTRRYRRNACWLAAGVMAAFLAGPAAVAKSGPPSARELQNREGRPLSVLLLRVVLEVDGQPGVAFRHASPVDNVSFGLSDFSTGMSAKPVTVRFLSDNTRMDGWAYLVLDLGPHYIAAREPMSTNAFAYDARWKTCPRWSLEIPADARLVYGGTLFLPGKGRAMIFGPRQMVEFDSTRLEVRDESSEAGAICRKWFPDLLPLSVQLAKEHRHGDTMIIETPPEK